MNDINQHAGRAPGTRIVDTVGHAPRVVSRQVVWVVEQVWNGGARSFEVHAGAGETEVDLTVDGAFDEMPTDEDIAGLLAATDSCGTCGGSGQMPLPDVEMPDGKAMCDWFPCPACGSGG